MVSGRSHSRVVVAAQFVVSMRLNATGEPVNILDLPARLYDTTELRFMTENYG